MSDLGERWDALVDLAAGSHPAQTVRAGRAFVRDNPEFAAAWMLVAEALTDLARYEEAEQAYAKALEHMSADGKRLALAGVGHLFRAAGDYEQAASWYRKAIEAAPTNAAYRVYLGAILAKQGRLHEAEEVHRTALTCEEGDISEAYLNLGSVLRSRDRFADAAECFRAALLLDPDYEEAKAALNDVLGCH